MCSAPQDKRTQYACAHVDLGLSVFMMVPASGSIFANQTQKPPPLHDIKIQIANQTTFSIQAEEIMPKKSVRIAKATNRPHVGLIASGAI